MSKIDQYLRDLRSLHVERGVAFRPNDPATDDQLLSAEREIGFTIIDGLRDLWRTCNGAEYWTTFFGVVSDQPTPCRFLSIEEAVKRWHELKGFTDDYEQDSPRDDRIASGWTNARWLPFAEFNGFSTCVMYDRAPQPTGTDGQIIAYQHDPDAIYWVAASFPDFLQPSIEILRSEGFVE